MGTFNKIGVLEKSTMTGGRQVDARCEHDAVPKVSGAVLVVDDEAIIRTMLAEELREAGLFVVECGSADEALLVLGWGEPIGLLLSDIRMPGAMDGADLARLARQD